MQTNTLSTKWKELSFKTTSLSLGVKSGRWIIISHPPSEMKHFWVREGGRVTQTALLGEGGHSLSSQKSRARLMHIHYNGSSPSCNPLLIIHNLNNPETHSWLSPRLKMRQIAPRPPNSIIWSAGGLGPLGHISPRSPENQSLLHLSEFDIAKVLTKLYYMSTNPRRCACFLPWSTRLIMTGHYREFNLSLTRICFEKRIDFWRGRR